MTLPLVTFVIGMFCIFLAGINVSGGPHFSFGWAGLFLVFLSQKL